MILTNCTDTRRGIMLASGIKYLEPREMWRVPGGEREEIRALFASRSFQTFVDQDIFRVNALGEDESCTLVKTPEPPAGLIDPTQVDGLSAAVGPHTGSRGRAPKVVEYQRGGPDVSLSKQRKSQE